jgi:hypothetical protein
VNGLPTELLDELRELEAAIFEVEALTDEGEGPDTAIGCYCYCSTGCCCN